MPCCFGYRFCFIQHFWRLSVRTLTTDDLNRQPQQLIDDAQRGEPSLVLRDGKPLFLSVPLGKGVESPAVRMEFALSLYDRGQISLGLAAHIAGCSVSEMIDELGRRGIALVRYDADDLTRELDYVCGLAGG